MQSLFIPKLRIYDAVLTIFLLEAYNNATLSSKMGDHFAGPADLAGNQFALSLQRIRHNESATRS